jgi:hypothetical protein
VYVESRNRKGAGEGDRETERQREIGKLHNEVENDHTA